MSIGKKLAFVPLAVSALAFAAPAHAEWHEAKSRHFTVFADLPENDLRERTVKLEKFDAVLRGLFKVETDDQATIYYVPSMDDVSRLAGRANVGGFYRPDAQGSLAIIPERLPKMRDMEGVKPTPERIMYHEYTHHMLLSNMGKFFPSWATEGLAELFMSAQFDAAGNVIIGAPNADRSWAMGGMNRWTVRRLLESDTNPPKGEERIELYSRGWLLCHYLLISGNRPGQFFKYINAINAGAPPLKAGEAAFGDLDAFDRELERYVRRSSFPSSKLSSDKVKTPTEVSVRTLGPGEAAIIEYRMISANGVTAKTAGPLAERARPVAARYPDDVFVQRAITEMEYDAKNYAAADAAANRLLALDPKNIMGLVYKGRIAAQRAIESKDANGWREARRWFLQANKLDPNYALPFALYYDSFVAAGQTPPDAAITGINRAVVLVPADQSLRIRAGIAALRAGDLKLSRMVLAPIAFTAHGGDKNPYATLIKEMDAGADKAALLAKAAELKIDKINEFTGSADDAAKKDS